MARILIIEDEEDLAELYRLALEEGGHRVVGIYGDPRRAVMHMPRRPPPEVVILDERLGEFSGIAFIERVRKRYPGVRIILATADPEAAKSARVAGADEGKQKPFTLEHLVKNVGDLIAGR